MTWYRKVSTNIAELPAFIEHYEAELLLAKRDVMIYGNVEKSIAALPGITEHRFNQLQEIEAVLRFMEIQIKTIRRKYFQKYLEAYQRVLTSRDAEKYTDGEDEVCEYEYLINEVALMRNKWMGVLKGVESKSFSLSNITRLRCAGMEDITL
jgi:hypothetical protein